MLTDQARDFHEETPEQAASAPDMGSAGTRNPRRGSTLEGRIRSLLQARGYSASTNKIVLDHEIDVWGEDDQGRVALAECKEYYSSGPVSSGQIRNFFGKIYDIEHNYGENVYLKMFVSISGFTDSAASLCERLGIMAVDADSLDILEQTHDEIVPRYAALEDKAVIELRKQRDKLQQEINRRNLVRKLGQQIDEYSRIIETKSLPSFLVPSAASNAFWYSSVKEIPFVGLVGEFEDFAAPAFPHISYLVYKQRRFLGRREKCTLVSPLHMEGGIIRISPEALSEQSTVIPDDASPRLSALLNAPVVTLDNVQLGTAIDLQITYHRDIWSVSCVKISSNREFRSQLSEPEFGIPSERMSLKEGDNGWLFVAHVKLATEIAAASD